MSREVLATDLDDVMVPSAVRILEYYNSSYGTNIQPINFYNYAMWGDEDQEVKAERVNKFLVTPDFIDAEPDPDAPGVYDRLRSKYDLVIITGRPEIIKDQTCVWLEEHFPGFFKDAIFTDYFNDRRARTKGDICKAIGTVGLIDDHIVHAYLAHLMGIEGVLYGDFAWNQSTAALPSGIVRRSSLLEVAKHFGV